jgi:hypothetical protein
MELRLIIAYGLMALLAAFAVALVLWRRHNAYDRTAVRGRRRERESYERRMAKREPGGE